MVNLYLRRRVRSIIILSLSVGATIIGVGLLALILGDLLYEGVSGLSLSVFTEMTPPPGAEGGGLLNPIVGSLILTALAVMIG
ncbi:MAG TPA: phosphate ABC transporter permease PtsA, partial [Xanthobacteraceae bacterium]|nr:phosphate ABC transporter permease PtsA [Xanthobacteraceae bacterium]